MAHFTVIGLGRFGIAASLELVHLGHTVTGIDRDAKVVDQIVDQLTQVAICDGSDENTLRELALTQSEAVLVAIGEDMQSSLLCTLALKNLGVKEIWVKATTNAHHTILSKLGVQRIIHPEEDMGVRVAQALNYPMVNNYLPLGHGLYVVEINIKAALEGVSLACLLGKLKSTVRALLVKRDDQIMSDINDEFLLNKNDTVLLCGTRSQLKYLAPRLA